MNLRALLTGLHLLLPLTVGAAVGSSSAVWLGDPQAYPGMPWNAEILSSGLSGSILSIECPGFWLETIQQDGEFRSRAVLNGAGTTTRPGCPQLPAVGKILAIPADRAVEVIVKEVVFQSFPCENPYLAEPIEGGATPANQMPSSNDIYPERWAEAFPPAICKDYRVVPLNIYPLRYDPVTRELLLATHLEIEVKTTEPSSENVKTYFAMTSQAFAPLYQAMIDNLSEFNTATPLAAEAVRGKYLIVINENYQSNSYLNTFMTWKRELGYQVVLKTIVSTTSKEEITEVIRAEYYAGDAPLDYVLLIGDTVDPIKIPAYTIIKPGGGEYDPTDHPYSMLEGLDYFPDVMVGRITAGSDIELSTVLRKTLAYEKDPYTANPGWFKKALISAGNYSDQGIAPITPAWTSLWLMDKLYDFGYTQVDTVIYWGPGNPYSYPGTANIQSSINNGVSLVAYRGWADANGWQYPIFDRTAINQLTNGLRLPVMVSIVCNTGNFGHATVNPCFGEAWLRSGTPTNPKGGVAFYGPSDLHTNTKWNNAMYAGFFEGLLEENLYRIGQSAFRAKLELYYGFPENTGINDYTEFYFHVYNILGDPALPIWTDIPAQITLNPPAQILPGRQLIEATVHRQDGSPLGGAYVSFYKEGEVAAGGITNGEGRVAVQIQPLTADTILTATASMQNCKPVQVSIAVQINDLPVGISAVNVNDNGYLKTGESSEVRVRLRNFGDAPLSNLQAVLIESDPFATVEDSSAEIASIAPAGESDASFAVALSGAASQGHVVEFTLNLSDGVHTTDAKFILPVEGLQFIPVEISLAGGSLEPGNTAQVRLFILNAGNLAAQGITGVLTSGTTAVSILAGQSGFPALPPNAVGMSNEAFSLQVNPAAAKGQQVILDLALTTSGGFAQNLALPLQLGQAASTDPLGPDSYGYYAYDDTDQGYAAAPTFNWIELDPEFGGAGAAYLPLDDDASTVVNLPFPFTYYGISYDTITICSNGWISMGPTWMANFRNWNMPSALGPPALIAAFWDDLKPDTSLSPSIRVFTRYDDVQGRYVIEWSRPVNRRNYETPLFWKEETFEIVLYDPAQHPTVTGDGDILFQYLVVNDVDDENNYATVGIEDEGHRRALQYAYSRNYSSAAAQLENQRAIRISTNPPNNTDGSGKGSPPLRDLRFEVPQPNPANPGTTFRFILLRDGIAQMKLYDTQGRRVATLLQSALPAGSHRCELSNRTLPSGLYFAVLEFEGSKAVQKVLILK